MSKIYKFSHLFYVIPSIYFVPFDRIIFGLHLRHYTQLLVAKSTSAKIFFHPLQRMDIIASGLKSKLNIYILRLSPPILPTGSVDSDPMNPFFI
jgi:hypothetical protein